MAIEMAKDAIDRRSLRTKAMLQHAMNSLIQKKDYEAITIKDICDAANVGRSTFYAHYTGKDDLKRKGFDKLRKELVDRQSEALTTAAGDRDRSLGFSLTMFEHARDHVDHYRALVGGRGGAVSLGSIRRILSDFVRNGIAATLDKKYPGPTPPRPVVHYIGGAFMAVLTRWAHGGTKMP